MTRSPLLYLGSEAVRRAVAQIDPIAAVHEALVLHADGEAVVAPESYMGWSPQPGENARSLSMPGRLAGDLRAAGVKIINANPANPARGMPRAEGLFVLFDYATAHPTAVLEGGELSALRTAAVSAASAMHLMPAPGGTLTVIGAGVLGRAHAELMMARLGFDSLLVHDQDPARAEALAAPLAGRCKADVELDLARAVEAASVVVTATTTTTPYISLNMVGPGTVCVNVSLDDLDETVFLGADRLYVDDWDLIVADDHRLLGRLVRAGRIGRRGQDPLPIAARPIDGTLGELLCGRAFGRTSPTEVIVVNPFGMAVCDLALARLVYDFAVQHGWGVALERGERAWR
jgi:N-[(2S)-2-amino-2-carboxyethyl]-L-glutamate dehydrogenase